MSDPADSTSLARTKLIEERYGECHTHMRASDQKRDVILGVYATLSIGLYGLSARSTAAVVEMPFVVLRGTDLMLIVVVGLVLTGLLMGGLFTLYRAWHMLYIMQAIVLQFIHTTNGEVSAKLVANAPVRFQLYPSIELLMFLILHVIIALHVVALWLISSTLPPVVRWTMLGITGSLILLEFGGHFVLMSILDSSKRQGKLKPEQMWLLQGLFSASDIEPPPDSGKPGA